MQINMKIKVKIKVYPVYRYHHEKLHPTDRGKRSRGRSRSRWADYFRELVVGPKWRETESSGQS